MLTGEIAFSKNQIGRAEKLTAAHRNPAQQRFPDL
jgi:hypothetical protein